MKPVAANRICPTNSDRTTKMTIKEYIPNELLRPFIKGYKIIESQGELTNRVVPDTSFAIAFRLKGQIAYISNDLKTVLPMTVLSGLRKSVRLINYSPETSALIVLFTATGISAFFTQPLYTLFEESVSLDNFFRQSEMAALEDQLSEADDSKSRIAIVEQFFYSKLINTHPDALVAEAINKIHLSNGLIRMKALAGSLFISQDAFEKRFRKVTGTSPKQFSSIIKMKTIIQKGTAASFLDISHNYGFYDQAHFNKDFKIFTGLTPTSFFKSGSYW